MKQPPAAPRSQVFAALLKHWRTRSGLSQLDLALSAGVSARHISFLETGRSQPSREMVLLLGAALEVPLREQNEMLREAGHEPAFDDPSPGLPQDSAIDHALRIMLRHHEPFPMLVLDRWHDVVRANTAMGRLVEHCAGAAPERWNGLHAFFDESLLRPNVLDWEATARTVVARVHREVLRSPGDVRLRRLLERMLDAPGVPAAWKAPDPARGTEGALSVRLRVQDRVLVFVATLTAFQVPQNITVDELRIESYFPADAATERACEELLGDGFPRRPPRHQAAG